MTLATLHDLFKDWVLDRLSPNQWMIKTDSIQPYILFWHRTSFGLTDELKKG